MAFITTKHRGYLVMVVILLTSCRGASGGTPTPTSPDPQAVMTAAAATAQFRMTELAASVPTTTPTTAITDTPTPTTTPTLGPPTITPTSPPAGAEAIEFVADVTVPDGTSFSPGASFTKTWRLRNAGVTTWTTAYTLVFSSGAQMSGPASVPLSKEVRPGEEIDVSVTLVAPNTAGSHIGYWMLRNASQVNFGIGPGINQPFYVQINVTGTGATSAATSAATPGTALPSATPGSDEVGEVSLSVDEAQVEGACPHSFNFSAQFTLSQAATVTYRLEAETGFEITLPEPTTIALGAGKHTVVYTLEFTDSLTGTARFRLTSPKNAQSNVVNFSLTCTP